MRYIAAYLLLKIGGTETPSASDIIRVIQSVGIEVDEERVDTLLSELDGKDINAVRFLSVYLATTSNVPFHSSSPRALTS